MISVPLLPEILCVLQTKENLINDSVLFDKASGIHGAFYAIGCILAPLIGGLVF
jgi:hypothetical protein